MLFFEFLNLSFLQQTFVNIFTEIDEDGYPLEKNYWDEDEEEEDYYEDDEEEEEEIEEGWA